MPYSLASSVFYSLLALTIWTFIVVQSIRMYLYYRLEQKSRSWPVVQATIQRSAAIFTGPSWSFTAGIPKSLFGYAYTVGNVHYIGCFAVSREDSLSAVALQEKLNGRSVTVRYDPVEPNKSFLAISEIDGKPIHHNPNWIPTSMRFGSS